jgi:hypothetical protein
LGRFNFTDQDRASVTDRNDNQLLDPNLGPSSTMNLSHVGTRMQLNQTQQYDMDRGNELDFDDHRSQISRTSKKRQFSANKTAGEL